MVGLPARGKSFISMQLARFLQWKGCQTQVFNAGNHRRKTETGVQDASYFDPNSAASVARRETIAAAVLDEMISWLAEGADRFAVFDATNTTRSRRCKVAEKLRAVPGVGVIFVESICDDAVVLEANLMLKLNKSPDYAHVRKEEARQDLLRRIGHYEKVYEPVDEEEMMLGGERVQVSYIKLLNFSSHVVAHNIWGRVATTVLPYLMSLHVGSRPVWLVRLPHSAMSPHAWRKQGKPWPPPVDMQFSEQPLSEQGAAFAEALAAFTARQAPSIAVFTCTHRRGLQLAECLGGGRVRTALNPQDRGACDGLSNAELPRQAAEVWDDPLHQRFPGGESLADMLQRLAPILIELEQEMRPVLVAAPLSVLQVLYCYYAALPVAQAMTQALPMHTIVELRPAGADFSERRFGVEDINGSA